MVGNLRGSRLRAFFALIVVVLAGCSGAHDPSAGQLQNDRAVEELQESVAGANVVICVIDAARADHVGCYGYIRGTTPNIEEIAEEGLVFENHFVQATWTKESTACLFSSQYCDTHLAFGRRALPAGAFTIAKGLGEVGFKTALFTSNLQASPDYGLGDDFQEIYWWPTLKQLVRRGELIRSPEVLLRAFAPWLKEHQQSRFFAYLHFMPPHGPYATPDDMIAVFADRVPPGYHPDKYHPGQFDFPIEVQEDEPFPRLPEWINRYDSHLRYADWAVGEVVELLRGADALERTLLIVTSDHGEAFGEHGFVWHAPAIHDEASRVPLLIRFPGGELTGRVTALTQAIDLLPTLFDLLRVPYPADEVQGRSLLPLITGESDDVHHYVFTRGREDGGKYMVRGTRYSLLLFGNGEWRLLYDCQEDPEQTCNVIGEEPEVAEEMLAAFADFAAAQRRPPVNFLDPDAQLPPLPPQPEAELDPEHKRELRALGYL